MFKIHDTQTGATFLSFSTEARAQAYCDEWRVKAGRTDLIVVGG